MVKEYFAGFIDIEDVAFVFNSKNAAFWRFYWLLGNIHFAFTDFLGNCLNHASNTSFDTPGENEISIRVDNNSGPVSANEQAANIFSKSVDHIRSKQILQGKGDNGDTC